MDSSAFLKIPLFKDISAEDLASLVHELPVETYSAGDYVFYEGDPGNSLYVVKKGEIQVSFFNRIRFKRFFKPIHGDAIENKNLF